MRKIVRVFLIVFSLFSFNNIYADIPPSLLKGDINNDGETDISDVILCLRQAISLDPANPEKADINNDEDIDISDVILILRRAIDPFDIKRAVAVFDNSTDTTSSLFSLEHALKVAGIPYIITKDIGLAVKFSVIITSSTISSTSFNPDERNTLIEWVENGGILVAPGVNTSNFYSVFGISGYNRINTRHTMTWNILSGDPTLSWFDHENEKTISLGNPRYPEVIYTRAYTLNGATPLAFFDDGSVAVTKNRFGSGYAYALGFTFSDLILRNQTNNDYEAQRIYSNGFEPTSDTVFLFLRAIFENHIPFAAWKYTIPDTNRSVLIMTHDACSSAVTSMNYMVLCAQMENQRGIKATYNIVTHYFSDAYLPDFYSNNIDKFRTLINYGHNIGSHSVGHFPDFSSSIIFPEGNPGNTRENYNPYYDGTQTRNGTVYGEIEVSKIVLETDLGVDVKTFRSGHLAFNNKQINVMDNLGYRYDSSFSANDVLTNFPYLSKYDRSFSGMTSNVYEIPITISDVLDIDTQTYPDVVQQWLSVIEANTNNFAPTTILIHPNRDYKLLAEELLLDNLPQDISVLDMETFGDFWEKRDRFCFITDFSENSGNKKLKILISNDSFPAENLTIFIKGGKLLSEITVRDENGRQINFKVSEGTGTSDILIYDFEQ